MRKRIALFLACFMIASLAIAQTRVTGTVVSVEDGEPIPGAQVLIEGTKTGVVTNADGKFSLTVPASAKRLAVSCSGMVPQLVRVKPVVNVELQVDNKALEEVMVVAYGTATRSSFTGSASVVGAESIEKQVATNVTSALAGSTPGVQYIASNGDPASNGATIRIRGIGSINASNSPLYVVDGVPYDGSISAINPQDVESMTVLKDASAAAIYGARGANGVILITTKKGKKGQKADVKFDAKWGSNSRLVPNYDVVTDPGQYYLGVFQRLYNNNIASGYDAAYAYSNANARLYDSANGGVGYQIYTLPEGQNLIGTNMQLNPNARLGYSDGTYFYQPDNWYDNAFHNSFRQEYNFSVSGSSDRINVYAGGGFLKDGGIVNYSEMKRYTGRLNMEYRATDWLRLSTNMNYSHRDGMQPSYTTDDWASSGNIFYIANTIAPIYPLYVRDAQGNIMRDGGRIVYDANQTPFKRANVVGNAIRDNEYDRDKFYNDTFTGNWGLAINPVKGLTISGNLGLTASNTRSNYLSSVFGSSSTTDGYTSVSHGRTFSVNTQLLADYKTDFKGSKHNLDIMVGYEQYKYKYQYLNARNTNLYSPYVGELDNSKSQKNRQLSSYTDKHMLEGILSRVQYDYDGKYFVSGSYRRDASSRFAPGHRWGNFGSAGIAWLMNKENFLSNASWIDMLKFKASYGLQGNEGLGNYYVYADMYSTSLNEGTGEYANQLVQKGNDELTWEKSHAINVGFDFNFFKSRFNGTVEYFVRKTTDMLFYKDFPLSSGFGTSVQLPVNVGSVMNHGIEFDLEGVVVSTEDFKLTLNANLTHYKNKILTLDEQYKKDGIKYSNAILREGGSIYETYMYKFAGLDENGSALYYKDVLDTKDDLTKPLTNADGTPKLDSEGKQMYEQIEYVKEVTTTTDATAATRYECGTTLPKVYGGFGLTFEFKGFDLSASFSYQLGGKIYDGQYQNLMWTQDNTGNTMHKDALNAWSTSNTNSTIPRWDNFAWGNLGQSNCDYFLTKSNYLSLNNAQFGYTLPKDVLKKLRLTNVRIYVAGENLMLLTCRKGLDPRLTAFGIGSMTSGQGRASSGNYSAMRAITGGITVNF